MSMPVLAAPRRRIVKFVDHVLDSMQDVEESLQWSSALGGGMAPTEPERGLQLTVKSGQLPEDVSGVYMRVGPNVQHWPPKKRTHVFDGDGMIHSVRIAKGTATYNCDYMETPRLKIERDLGEEWFTRIGEFHGKSGLAKILGVAPSKAKLYGLEAWETSTANTAIGFTPEGKLWALNEGGAPFRFRVDEQGAVDSMGFDTLLGTHEMYISAHPKFDYRTGETFFHGKDQVNGRFYVGRAVDDKLVDCVDLKVPNGFNHDMFITENFICIIDGSMRFTPKGVVQKKPLWCFDPNEKLRFGIFPRSAGKMTPDAWIWIEADVAADIVHTLYAYDEGGRIVLWSPVMFYEAEKVSGILGGVGSSKMHKIVIDVEMKTASLQLAPGGEDMITEFPRVRDDRSGLRCRYGFSGRQDGIYQTEFNFIGMLKWDFEEGKLCGEIAFPDGVVGGEPVLFPRNDSSPDEAGDNGYIGMFLWNYKSSESTFAIYDARSFSAVPVVEFSVPRRVPLGFHALYITEEQLQMQLLKA